MGKNPSRSGPDSRRHWEARLATLRREDWDKRVRISAGDRDGARVGSVAQVPPVGIKLALREAMIERAEAEIARIAVRRELDALRLKRMSKAWGAFAAGGALVAIIAAAGRLIWP